MVPSRRFLQVLRMKSGFLGSSPLNINSDTAGPTMPILLLSPPICVCAYLFFNLCNTEFEDVISDPFPRSQTQHQLYLCLFGFQVEWFFHLLLEVHLRLQYPYSQPPDQLSLSRVYDFVFYCCRLS